MKHSLFKWGIAPLVACALLSPISMWAQAVKFEAKSWFIAELVPGILFISNSGQVSFKNEVHIARTVSDEPRAAGRVQAVNLDVSLNSDGTGTFIGKACVEVGIWDAAGNFTRTDGAWDLKYDGVIKSDGSTAYKFVGSGMGGTIDGLHVVMTGTRASSSPTVPYRFSGIMTGKNK
jgi:hypothetical protein